MATQGISTYGRTTQGTSIHWMAAQGMSIYRKATRGMSTKLLTQRKWRYYLPMGWLLTFYPMKNLLTDNLYATKQLIQMSTIYAEYWLRNTHCPKIIWIIAGADATVIVQLWHIWHRNQAYAPIVTGSIIMQRFRLFLGQCRFSLGQCAYVSMRPTVY